MKRFAAYCLLACTILFAAGCKKKQEETALPTVGIQEKKPVPDITVVSLKNEPLQLSSLKGKVVMLNFWATWCPPCREEIPSMMKLNKAMAGKPFQMLAVSIDEGGIPDVEAYFKSSGYSLPAYLDQGGAAQKAYGVTGVPETFVIDKNGILVKKVIGPLAWDSAETIAFIEGLMK